MTTVLLSARGEMYTYLKQVLQERQSDNMWSKIYAGLLQQTHWVECILIFFFSPEVGFQIYKVSYIAYQYQVSLSKYS